MNTKIKNAIILVIILSLIGCYFWPKTFANNVDLQDVDHIEVFDGHTGKGFTITDRVDIDYIIENLQNNPLRRNGISLGMMGYGLRISIKDCNDKNLTPDFIINSDNVIRKDPFFYVCKGGLCYAYINNIETELSENANLEDPTIARR